MILLKKLSPLIFFMAFATLLYAQDADVSSLIKEGIRLNSGKNYADAVEKYKQALTVQPGNAQANYQLAFTLAAMGKGADAVPYLNKVTQTSTDFTEPAFELLGSIYDAARQPLQAIEAYRQGIKIKPDNGPLYFNLGLAYFRANKFADAELAAIQAIKLDPGQANSHRLYGLVTFHQNKRAQALMGFCSYLLLAPDGPRADEVYTNLQSILKGGDLKTGVKTDAQTITLNKTLNAAIAMADEGKGPSALLETQLKNVFGAIGRLAEKQPGKDFFCNFYACFFYRLSQTGNMPAFARLIGLNGNKAANTQWLQDNDDKRKALEAWVAGAGRKF